jgi:hypothetical protein
MAQLAMGFAFAQPILRIARTASVIQKRSRTTTTSPFLQINGPLVYQQGTQRQQRGAHALIQPGPQPQ